MQVRGAGHRPCLKGFRVRGPWVGVPMVLWLLLPCIVTLQAGRAENPPRQADFLIVERAGALRVYDHYQQPVRDPGLHGMLPFTPFRITAWQSVMGDGLTSSSVVELHGRRYFLLRDPETRLLVGEHGAGYTLTVRAAEILDDTLLVTAPRGVELLAPRGSAAIRLTRGDRLIRLFRWQGRTFGFTDRAGGSFGWISLPAGAARTHTSTIQETAGTGASPPAGIASRIRATVDELNSTLRRLHAFLDGETGIRREPPQWSVEREGGLFLCVLHSDLPAAAYAGSSAQLAKRIEGRLLGTGYSVHHQPGRIEIQP
jgi:hypothetical protein